MLKHFIRRQKRKLRSSLRESIIQIKPPILWIFAGFAVIPPVLLSGLTISRAIFLPASLPKPPLPWGLYLPLWTAFSILPAVSAAYAYSTMHIGCRNRCIQALTISLLSLWIYTLWQLLALAGVGGFILFLCSFVTAITALWVLPLYGCQSTGAFLASALFALWSVFLFLRNIRLLSGG